jgi:hypothetical protein
MGDNAKVVLDRTFYEEITSEIKSLSTVCKDEFVKAKLINLNKRLDVLKNEQCRVINLQERIVEKMEETRGKDPDFSARLYILHQDLKREKISEELALEIFERSLKYKHFDKR